RGLSLYTLQLESALPPSVTQSLCRTRATQAARPKALASLSCPPLRLNHSSERVERGFGHRLRERRMRVDCKLHFLDRELVRPRHHDLMNQFRGVRAADVRAEYLPVCRIANDLHEALGLARRARSAACHERELANLVIELLVLALLLGEPDRRDLRVAVGRVRDVVVVHPVRALAGEILGEHNALALALMRQHRGTGYVADGVDALGARLHVLVDLDEA